MAIFEGKKNGNGGYQWERFNQIVERGGMGVILWENTAILQLLSSGLIIEFVLNEKCLDGLHDISQGDKRKDVLGCKL